MRLYVVISLILIVFLIIPVAQSASSSAQTISSSGMIWSEIRLMDTFHTGAPAWDYLYQESNYQNGNYLRWNTAKPYIKYAQIQGAATLLNDGTLVYNMYLDVSWTGITRQLTAIYSSGAMPVLEIWLTNFESVSESGLRIFFSRLSSWLDDKKLIFNPAFEYNYPSTNPGWGDRGNGQTFKIESGAYNEKMQLIRKVLTEAGITNIYLGSHGNMGVVDATNMNGLIEYLPGIRQADVIGFSFYYSDIDRMWLHASIVYEKMGLAKPFLFFEYAPDSPWATGLNVTAQFVDATYAKIPQYSFVKGLIWYFGSYFTQDTIQAITRNSQLYDGYNR